MATNYDDVFDFHAKFNQLRSEVPRHLTRRKLNERIEFMAEELDEFKTAADRQDLEAQFDALIDLVYVAMGTAVMLGLPWQTGWEEVHGANMAKVVGRTKRGHSGDVAKPPGWRPPDLYRVLDDAGYDPDRFGRRVLCVEEGLCVDDVSAGGVIAQELDFAGEG